MFTLTGQNNMSNCIPKSFACLLWLAKITCRIVFQNSLHVYFDWPK